MTCGKCKIGLEGKVTGIVLSGLGFVAGVGTALGGIGMIGECTYRNMANNASNNSNLLYKGIATLIIGTAAATWFAEVLKSKMHDYQSKTSGYK